MYAHARRQCGMHCSKSSVSWGAQESSSVALCHREVGSTSAAGSEGLSSVPAASSSSALNLGVGRPVTWASTASSCSHGSAEKVRAAIAPAAARLTVKYLAPTKGTRAPLDRRAPSSASMLQIMHSVYQDTGTRLQMCNLPCDCRCEEADLRLTLRGRRTAQAGLALGHTKPSNGSARRTSEAAP